MCVKASFFVVVLYLYEELVELSIKDVYSCSIVLKHFFNVSVVKQL